MGSRLYGVGRGKKKLIGKSSYSPRQQRRAIQSWSSGTHNLAHTRSSTWKPKRRRRKLGARRKTTLVQQLFRWVKVPTRVRRRRVR